MTLIVGKYYEHYSDYQGIGSAHPHLCEYVHTDGSWAVFLVRSDHDVSQRYVVDSKNFGDYTPKKTKVTYTATVYLYKDKSNGCMGASARKKPWEYFNLVDTKEVTFEWEE